jgi:hypothetical protein
VRCCILHAMQQVTESSCGGCRQFAAAFLNQHCRPWHAGNWCISALRHQHLAYGEHSMQHTNCAAACNITSSHFAKVCCSCVRSMQDAQQCLELLRKAAARAGLLSPTRHPHWPTATGEHCMQHKHCATSMQCYCKHALSLTDLLCWPLQDAQQCLQLMRAASARAGLLSPTRYPKLQCTDCCSMIAVHRMRSGAWSCCGQHQPGLGCCHPPGTPTGPRHASGWGMLWQDCSSTSR